MRCANLLAGLGATASGVLDLREGIHALLAHVVPALAPNATVALVVDAGVVTHAATRSVLFEDDAASVDLSPSGLPSRAFRDLRCARRWTCPRPDARAPPLADGALQIGTAGARRPLPRRPVDRRRDDAAVGRAAGRSGGRACIAFATASLYGALQVEIAERRQAEQRLEEASQRDEFLAMLAHELRNPLAPITNAVEVIVFRLRPRAGCAGPRTSPTARCAS